MTRKRTSKTVPGRPRGRDLLITLDHPRPEGELVPVAKLGKTWGVHGALIVRLYNPDSDLEWADAEVQWLRGQGLRATPVAVDEWLDKGGKLLLKLENIRSPEDAKPLTGLELLAPSERLPELEDPDEIYVHELNGMSVVDEVRGELGTIQAVFRTGANDVWVVRDGRGETLIPAIAQVVLDIDRDARRIRVHYELD